MFSDVSEMRLLHVRRRIARHRPCRTTFLVAYRDVGQDPQWRGRGSFSSSAGHETMLGRCQIRFGQCLAAQRSYVPCYGTS